ncbi:bifunctional [glutamate--ammonia ligase]-adenylyl-L-tyrosine phosphorylase/[glutamate--ammonia-ligase] adenylyltransferase [Seleniivibrio sp.]|uniref:bifunctional [glutamate--ammonia ligase]-adenylyl-L-tyrosine phosphorylase/[glutamate--ammonia-ligase] adenylyltransferase n=1 Tax=Seleniivibrio sp. TaxID=2898801 RepID=UPI0025DBAF1B|nr:bifunctional [glutamate--ammonia ligase]-adenylyl-L-tyrosine phosphorylase/[glutamate--ammonia-ligase] adenylyltransferase [Seleniivibrio sp.]MCD8554312.1 bifunctional [glutamate--ammonia ligase]-adenylyl-L-tyrosine phosphorylase/[glutamate--ammonia-ligase] adenylyltransferase [Seleniivibrio sp.]
MIAREKQTEAAAAENGVAPENVKVLTYIARHSEYIGIWLMNNPDRLKDAEKLFKTVRGKQTIVDDIMKADIFSMTEAEFMEHLRNIKMREYVCIAAEDMCFGASCADVTAHVSAFASACCEVAYQFADAQLKKLHGIPRDEDGNEVGFCVIGLGKLGGWELNFSSDIDVIYVYGCDIGNTDGAESIDNHTYFSRVAEYVTRYIGERTKDGIVFRVDLRLRPDGDRGALAMPVRAYETYYETYGQSWERMMLLKALPIAGSLEVGEAFKKAVKPFVFRRSLDFNLMNDLQDIKKKINKRVELKGSNVKHVKLGYGGIREIEFVVQTLQIINYPSNKAIFDPNTLKSLDILTKNRLMTPETSKILRENYCFLRKLEHMAQIENERQTHIVPEQSDTYPLYLERCGFASAADFEKKYSAVTKQVNDEFSKLFTDAGADEGVFLVFDGDISDEEAAGILKQLKINEPLECVKIVRRVMEGQKDRPRVKSDRQILKALFIMILNELEGKSGSVDVLHNFEKMLASNTTIYLLHDLFSTAPFIIQKLINIFSYSRYLTDQIMKNRDLLDYIYDPKPIDFTAEKIKEDFIQHTEKYRDMPDLMPEAARIRHKIFMFNAGYAYLSKQSNIIDTMRALTELARGTVDFAFSYIYDQLAEKYGHPKTEDGKPCGYLLVGMGKVGSIEMSFGSDIDLVFLYDGYGATDGENSITNQEFYSKMVQRSITFLSAYSHNGYLYKTDMRLRPSGSSGTLVTTLAGFEDYQKKGAMLWEKQALMRSSVINYNSPLAAEFERIKAQSLYVCLIADEGVKEIYDMRMRIENEKGLPYEKNDIKAGYGGLLDIEFSAQMFQLMYGCKYEQLHTPNTHDAIHFFKDLELVTSRDFYCFHKGYLFFRHLENLVRIYDNTDTSRLPKDEKLLDRMAEFFGYKSGGTALLEEYHNLRRSVRAAFKRVFGKD